MVELNNYPTPEEIKKFNSEKEVNNKPKGTWWKKRTISAITAMTLVAGPIAVDQIAHPQKVYASESNNKLHEIERERTSYLEKKFEDATYQEVYDLWAKGFDERIENENKIIYNRHYSYWTRKRAARTKYYLLKSKKMMGQLTIVKGYELEGKYSKSQAEYAQRVLLQLERTYLGRVLYYLGRDVWDGFWHVMKEIAKETGKVIDEAKDQID